GGMLVERLRAADGRWSGVVFALPEIVERVVRIEQSALDVALREYVARLSGVVDERLDAVLGRLGLDGGPPRSLPKAVNGAKVGPERIRQLQLRVLERLPSHPVYLPALDRA